MISRIPLTEVVRSRAKDPGMSHAVASLSSCHRHPLAQRPHVLGLLGLKDLKCQGFGTLRPQFTGTLDVEGEVNDLSVFMGLATT